MVGFVGKKNTGGFINEMRGEFLSLPSCNNPDDLLCSRRVQNPGHNQAGHRDERDWRTLSSQFFFLNELNLARVSVSLIEQFLIP
jgi:hypothetical protein